MPANQKYVEIDIEVIDDNQWEPDEAFFVKLSLYGDNKMAKIGQTSICMITIIDDDGSKNNISKMLKTFLNFNKIF